MGNADISNWDTSSVTTMDSMFYQASAFNQPLSFDTSKVTSMRLMFYQASAFNQPLSIDTSKVTNMGGMFWGVSVFNQPLSFDTSKVTSMHLMFHSARAFNQPLSFDTSKITSMHGMFWYTNFLSNTNKLLIRCAWAGTSALASAGYGSSWGPGTCPATFTDKASLQTAVQAYNTNPTAAIATYGPIAYWDVSGITDMSELFHNLQNFNADISKWDTSKVTNMYRMFRFAK